jgi:hypothetical protein
MILGSINMSGKFAELELPRSWPAFFEEHVGKVVFGVRLHDDYRDGSEAYFTSIPECRAWANSTAQLQDASELSGARLYATIYPIIVSPPNGIRSSFFGEDDINLLGALTEDEQGFVFYEWRTSNE